MLSHRLLGARTHQPCQLHHLTLQPACAPPRRLSRLLVSRCSPDDHIVMICNRCALTSQHAPTRCHLSFLHPERTARAFQGDSTAVNCRQRSLVATGERRCRGDHKEGCRAGLARPPCRPCAGPKPGGGVSGCMLDYSHARLHLDPVISSGRIRNRCVCGGRCWGRPLDARISAVY